MKNFYDYYRAKTAEHPQKWVFGEFRQRLTREGYCYTLAGAEGEIPIDETTACPYLGKSDKNGVPMFEHDILLLERTSNDAPLAEPTKTYWMGTLNNLLKYQDYIEEGVIIGNTFDNPELKYL